MPVVTSPQKAIQSEQKLFRFQIKRVALLSFSAFGLWIIEQIAPAFFNYPFFTWGGWESVQKFWPLFAYCIGLSLLIEFAGFPKRTIPRRDNVRLLGWEIATSTLAGFWEELGFRWIYICYAMLSIVVMNWIFGTFLAWVLAAFCLIGSLVLWNDKERVFAGIALCGAILAGLFAFYVNPVYLIYQGFVWVIHYSTFTLMDPVFQSNLTPLFLFGSVAANATFRDGHKYQGLFGFVNSWFCGMVLLYATITYGLWTAVVVHALYDIAIGVIRFAFQKTH